jgi:hypothetical protein
MFYIQCLKHQFFNDSTLKHVDNLNSRHKTVDESCGSESFNTAYSQKYISHTMYNPQKIPYSEAEMKSTR